MSTESDDQGKEVKKWDLTCWVEGCGAEYFSLKRCRVILNILQRNHFAKQAGCCFRTIDLLDYALGKSINL